MIRAAVIGATGYSGEVLVELLAGHPEVEVVALTSRSEADRRVSEVMPRLRGRADHLTFSTSDPTTVAAIGAEVFFLALPHGAAAEYALALVESGKRVIDLSADFRLNSAETYASYYGQAHPSSAWLEKSVYALPEITAADWESPLLFACPGCYPTSILLPLVPLLRDRVIEPGGIVINSASGVSGAGKKESVLYSYAERTESMMAYGVPRHRHLSEVEEQLGFAAEREVVVQFTPHLAPMRQGIHTTIVARPTGPGSVEAVRTSWKNNYENQPFVQVLKPGVFPDTQAIRQSNRVDLAAVFDERTGNYVFFSAIDNLVKGASGQAVQVMNRIFGLPETTGLR